MKRGEQFISVLFLNLIIIFIAIERGATQNCNTDVDMEIWYSGELNSTYSTDCYTVFANKTNVDNYFLRILTIVRNFFKYQQNYPILLFINNY